jgi:hypothetical protein
MKATHCWQVDGAWRVGSFAIALCFEEDMNCIVEARKVMREGGVKLLQHYHDPTKIEAVPVAWLKAYPVEEIKQP